jgi:CheY-like chemotaxis protein/two-component sensor histidine kinase
MGVLAHHAAIAIQHARLAEQLLLAERLSTVGRMVAGVAHELNNPLAVILGTLDLVGHETLPDRLAERLGRVYQQAQRAVKIVRTLLALARKRPAQRQAVDVNAAISGTLELLAYDPRHVDVRIVRRLATGLPPVLADPDQIQQVFTNLFLNASQAIREAHGQGTLTITSGLAPAGDRVVITVADTGPGIKAEHLARVFEPFFTTKGEGDGTGLGLAICQRIVENHGGRISVESRPGAGARFRIELPVDQAMAGDAPPRGHTAPGAQAVLVVEDEPLVADMVEDILAIEGHQVDRATTGREALARVGARAYALVICDMRMPDLDGPAFYEALRQRDPALARRVVFVTGDTASPDARHFLEESGAPYLAKPFAVADFKSAVRRVLGAE